MLASRSRERDVDYCICALMAEWLRRQTRNLLGSPRAGSNPAQCVAVIFGSVYLGACLKAQGCCWQLLAFCNNASGALLRLGLLTGRVTLPIGGQPCNLTSPNITMGNAPLISSHVLALNLCYSLYDPEKVCGENTGKSLKVEKSVTFYYVFILSFH